MKNNGSVDEEVCRERAANLQSGITQMARPRHIGAEILRGLRELKHGVYGGVTIVLNAAKIREQTGLRIQTTSRSCRKK